MNSSTASRLSQIETQLNTNEETAKTSFPFFLLAVLLHVGLALLLYTFRPALPTFYAFAVLAAGGYALLQKSPVPVVYVCAYITGAELVWRMTKADVFWETGKYAMILFMGLGLLRWRMRLHGLGVVYFLVLLPALILTLDVLPAPLARDQISFLLSGPLCLAVGVNFLQNVRLTREQAGNLLLIAILPVVCISTLALRSTLTSNIIFTPESNFVTSGGFGPNQVSALLGLGGLLCWLYLFVGRPGKVFFLSILALSGVFILQAVLTLSRGGVINLALAIPASTFFFLKGGSNFRRAFFVVLLLTILFAYTVPRLDAWTGGVIQIRYNDLDTTGRERLIQEDLRTWQENPVFGVGVGVSPLHRSTLAGNQVATHTEYSRMLAEHGIPGILAILLLLFMFLNGFRRARGRLSKGLLVGLMVWSLTEMTHAAMRIAAISFFFALPLAALYLDVEEEQES